MFKFFRLENNEVVINKEELYVVFPTAKALVQADRGQYKLKGDYDGRNKLMAIKQLGLVWWIVDVNSPGIQAGLEDSELIEDGIKQLEIPTDWNYKNDELFQNFLEDYSNWYNRLSYTKLLKQVLIAFNDSGEIIEVIRKQAKNKISEKIDLDPEDMKMIIMAQNQVIEIAGKIPENVKRLKELQVAVGKVEQENTIARGNVKITSSMRPNE